jgi:hypothetical protein
LPNQEVDDLQYRYNRGGQGLADAGNFRSYDTESEIASRPGIQRVTGELPPISRKVRFGEYDRLRQRRDPNESIALGLESDAARLAMGVGARMELARGDALVNGSVTIDENGLVATVDFARPSDCVVTPATAWSDLDDSTPINDLTTWQLAYLALTGDKPGAIVVSTKTAGLLQSNTSILRLAATVVGAPSLLSRQALQATLDAFGLPPLFVYDAMVNVGGTATRIVPDNKTLILPAAVAPDDSEGTQLGGTFWGTTAESLEPGYGLEISDAPGIVAGAYTTEDPVAIWTKAAAIGLPVLANPYLAWVATTS